MPMVNLTIMHWYIFVTRFTNIIHNISMHIQVCVAITCTLATYVRVLPKQIITHVYCICTQIHGEFYKVQIMVFRIENIDDVHFHAEYMYVYPYWKCCACYMQCTYVHAYRLSHSCYMPVP